MKTGHNIWSPIGFNAHTIWNQCYSIATKSTLTSMDIIYTRIDPRWGIARKVEE